MDLFQVFIIKQFLYEKDIKINWIRFGKIGEQGY